MMQMRGSSPELPKRDFDNKYINTVLRCFTQCCNNFPPNPFRQSSRTLSCGATRRSNGADGEGERSTSVNSHLDNLIILIDFG